jgi:hypothetical protein
MAKLIEVLLFGVGAILVFALIAVLIQAVIAIFRMAVLLCVASAIGIGVGFSAAAFGMDTTFASSAGLIAAFLAAAVFLRRGETESRRLRGRETKAAIPISAGVTPEGYGGPVESRGDRRVSQAWERLGTMIPERDIHRFNYARDRCARLLASSDANPLDLESTELAVLIRRSLPELASRNAALWNDADQADQTDLSAGILADVSRLEKIADARLSSHRGNRRDELETLRNHLAARTELDR